MMETPNKTDNGQLPLDPAKKRSCPRYPFSSAAEAFDVQASIRIKGRLCDISRNGCYMDTINPFAAKAVVTLVIAKDNQFFKTQAKVVYSQVGMGMGLLFTTADPDQLLLLGTWLAELDAGKQHDPVAPWLQLQADTSKNTNHELRDVIIELITLLSRKNIVNDSEGMALLRKLSK